MELQAIEVVEDLSAKSRCDEGFLKLSRLRVRNLYSDGSRSEIYSCDVMSRPGSDAVVAVLYEVRPDGGVDVVLREAPRVPVYLRRQKQFVHPDPREYTSLLEVVAGIVEADDPPGLSGMRRRAAVEAREEAGVDLPPEQYATLGGESFASPGTSDEKLHFLVGRSVAGAPAEPLGDGSVMEEWCRLHRFELGRAIRACREGQIPDMKTEVALLRLADHLGWIHQLGCFVSDLPQELQARFDPCGVERAAPA